MIRLIVHPVGAFKDDSPEEDAIGIYSMLFVPEWFKNELNIPVQVDEGHIIWSNKTYWTQRELWELFDIYRKEPYDVTMFVCKGQVEDPPGYSPKDPSKLNESVVLGQMPFIAEGGSKIWGYAEWNNQLSWLLRWFRPVVERLKKEVYVSWDIVALMLTSTFYVLSHELWHGLGYLAKKGDYAGDPHVDLWQAQYYRDEPGPGVDISRCSILDPYATFIAPYVSDAVKQKYW